MTRGKANVYDPKVIDYVIKNHKGITKKELVKLIYDDLGIVETPERIKLIMNKYHLRSGVDTRFKKGCVSYNKGLSQIEFMSQEKIDRTIDTRFKKGNVPSNIRPVGSTWVDKDGIIYVKIHNKPQTKRYDKWKSLHSVLWKIYNNQDIPKGDVIIFADGNNRNFDINNLVKVSHRELLYLNRHHLIYNDCELTKTGLLVAKIMIKTKNLEREKNND